MKKSILITVLISTLVPLTGFALRCGSDLVLEGDSEYSVIQACGEADGTNSNAWGDRKTLYYDNDGGAVEEVKILNGRVTDIEMNRK